MLDQLSGLCCFLTIVATLIACSPPQPPQSARLDERQQTIVFNDREIDQIRGELLRAAHETSYEIPQQQAYFRAHAANSVGVIQADVCDDGRQGMGSGVLSSAERLVTAWHTVGVDKEVQVTFANGDFLNTPPNVGLGSFLEDALMVGLPYNTISYSSSIIEENPMLANRLFSLGLHDWAQYANKGARDALRSWQFKPVDNANRGKWNGCESRIDQAA